MALLYCVILFALGVVLYRRYKFMRRCDKIPGPPSQIPFFGRYSELFLEHEKHIPHGFDLYEKYKKEPLIRTWVGPLPWFLLWSAESAEVVLGSNKILDKSEEYEYLHPWLSTGLLTSTGDKWRQRRKLITPAFHFKILEDFVQIFNEQSAVLVEKLKEKTGQPFDISPFITRCTLDVICETAMGCNLHAQSKSNTDYVEAVHKMSYILHARQVRPWLQPDWLFNLFPYGSEQKRCLSILHGFTDQVILERKIEHKLRKAQETQKAELLENEDDYLNSKKSRLAFLDLLIEASQDGKVLSDLDIREEVDTFMFEGHDTTASAIGWALFLIGNHSNVQEQLNEELGRVLGASNRPITMSDLSELKYLECCIKEALRLYSSVPVVARKLMEDTTICGYEVPIGSAVIVCTYILHKDPSYFPDPDKFQPERFFPENSRGRHPYAYIPFSAGPRNCIGQKFAMMEEKIILASILRNFHVKALDKPEDLAVLSEVVMRSRDGIRLQLTSKKLA